MKTREQLMDATLEIFHAKYDKAVRSRDTYMTGTLMYSYHDGQTKLGLSILRELKQLAFAEGLDTE
jgi:hypothetical protein